MIISYQNFPSSPNQDVPYCCSQYKFSYSMYIKKKRLKAEIQKLEHDLAQLQVVVDRNSERNTDLLQELQQYAEEKEKTAKRSD